MTPSDEPSWEIHRREAPPHSTPRPRSILAFPANSYSCFKTFCRKDSLIALRDHWFPPLPTAIPLSHPREPLGVSSSWSVPANPTWGPLVASGSIPPPGKGLKTEEGVRTRRGGWGRLTWAKPAASGWRGGQ